MSREQPASMTGHLTEPPAEHSEQLTGQGLSSLRWSVAEAARQCGVGRATVQRALQAGRLPNAEQGRRGWEIPVSDLIGAGFAPGRPTAPDAPAAPDRAAREHGRAPEPSRPEQVTGQLTEHPDTARLRALETELAVERARREAAEQLAAERAERVADLRSALRMLEAAPAEPPAPAPAPPPAPAAAAPEPAQDHRSDSLVLPSPGRVFGWLRGR